MPPDPLRISLHATTPDDAPPDEAVSAGLRLALQLHCSIHLIVRGHGAVTLSPGMTAADALLLLIHEKPGPAAAPATPRADLRNKWRGSGYDVMRFKDGWCPIGPGLRHPDGPDPVTLYVSEVSAWDSVEFEYDKAEKIGREAIVGLKELGYLVHPWDNHYAPRGNGLNPETLGMETFVTENQAWSAARRHWNKHAGMDVEPPIEPEPVDDLPPGWTVKQQGALTWAFGRTVGGVKGYRNTRDQAVSAAWDMHTKTSEGGVTAAANPYSVPPPGFTVVEDPREGGWVFNHDSLGGGLRPSWKEAVAAAHVLWRERNRHARPQGDPYSLPPGYSVVCNVAGNVDTWTLTGPGLTEPSEIHLSRGAAADAAWVAYLVPRLPWVPAKMPVPRKVPGLMLEQVNAAFQALAKLWAQAEEAGDVVVKNAAVRAAGTITQLTAIYPGKFTFATGPAAECMVNLEMEEGFNR